MILSRDLPEMVYSNTNVSRESQYGICLSFLLIIYIHLPNVIKDELIEMVSFKFYQLIILLFLTHSEPAKSTISKDDIYYLLLINNILKIAWLLDDLWFILVLLVFLFLIIILNIYSKSDIFVIFTHFNPYID